jgi:hypothetical protein
LLRRGVGVVKKWREQQRRKTKRRQRLGLDEKNEKQKKRNTSNQHLLNEQAHKLNKASYWMKVQG